MSDYKLFTVEKDSETVKLKASQLTCLKYFDCFQNPSSSYLMMAMFETADTDGRFHDVDNLPKWTRQ